MEDVVWTIGLSGGVALVAAVLLMPLVIRLAHRLGWVAAPRADRWHDTPTALMGGIGIYVAATTGLLAALGLEAFPWILWGGATLLFVTGLVDDLKGVSPVTKLVAQVLATVALLYAGYAFGQGGPFWLTIPFTFLWVIGITNAVNLLDNMDGLAAGTVMIAASVLGVFVVISGGNGGSVAAMLAVAGAAGGFLIYNFKPARIFMGDCGSLFLGYVLAAFAVVIQGGITGAEGLGIYLVSAAVLAVPIFDTTLVTIVRTLAGRALSQGGRDHSSHRLVRLGLSERRAVVTLYSISLAFGALALFFHYAEVQLFYATTALFLVGLVVFGVHLGRMDVYQRSVQGNGARRVPLHRRVWRELQQRTGDRVASVLRAILGRSWKPLIGMFADLILVSSAFVLAHYLRFEQGLAPQQEEMLMQALPGVVFLKLLVFLAGGLYRGMWRYAGVQELMRIVGSSAAASAITYAALTFLYGPGEWSMAVFFIDWLIVTLVITVVRFAFRGLHQYFRARRMTGRRTLVCGAGDAGLLILRALRQQVQPGLRPVGYLDEDAYKRGYTAQGLAVLGTLQELEDVCAEHRIEEVIVPAWQFSGDRKTDISAACERAGVNCRVFTLSLEPSADTSSNGVLKETVAVPARRP